MKGQTLQPSDLSFQVSAFHKDRVKLADGTGCGEVDMERADEGEAVA